VARLAIVDYGVALVAKSTFGLVELKEIPRRDTASFA
jgi:hypothetical protein